MTLTTQVTFKKTKTIITISSLDTIITLNNIKTLPKSLKEENIYLLYEESKPVFIGLKKDISPFKHPSFDLLIEIQTNQDIEPVYLKRLLTYSALENGVVLSTEDDILVPENIAVTFKELHESILLILDKMNLSFLPQEKKKARPAKARHKWTKDVSEIEFHIDTRESIATVMWIKRNQMLIKKGATMMKEAPLNKDGSVGFSAKMGEKIRSENIDKFENFVTTEDIILKSVNEVGLFLYFAGTNSWLEMVDKDGKTLNEWTVVE